MIGKILSMIKQGYYSLVDPDTSVFPVGQATVNEKATRFVRLSTYGVFSNPPENSHVLLLSSQGQESIKFGIINDFKNRKKGTKGGECGLENTLTGTFIYLKENGDIDIEAPNTNHAGNVNITGDVSITGNLTMEGNLTVTGDVDITGDLDMTGTATIETDAIIGTKSFLTHTHTQPNDSGGDTESPTLPPT